MFHGPKDLADAHERYCVAEAEGSSEDISDEDASMHISYLELVRYVPMVNRLEQEANALNALHNDVSFHFNHNLFHIYV